MLSCIKKCRNFIEMKPHKSLLILLLILPLAFLKATHNRAGEILYKRIAPYTAQVGGLTVQVYTYSFTIIKYTNDGSNIADRCVDTLDFGDGTKGVAQRINGGSALCGNSCSNCGEIILNDPGFIVKRNIYTITHTYPGPGNYLVKSYDPNRNGGVINIPNSIDKPFYIESLLIITPFRGANSSPVFNFPPIDKACTNVCFYHNPGAFDPDGDSLSYEITTSRGQDGNTVQGYTFPATGGGFYGIDAVGGTLSWCTPQLQGEYNLAFIVREWRKTTDNKTYELVGYVMRDMQVVVGNCISNQPPLISISTETCVEAGIQVEEPFTVTDPNNGQIIKLEGQGGAFSSVSPIANLSSTNFTANTVINGTFSWQTTCNHIRQQPYLSTLKATDNGTPIKLVHFTTFGVKVVPPRLTGLSAQPLGSAITLTWQPSPCNPSNNPLVQYKIYRKNECGTFTYTPCKMGVDPTSGYIQVGTTNVGITTFLDNNNGNGLVVGQDYSYIVIAVYTDGSQSFASTESCTRLKKDVPIITHVDVQTTSTTTGVMNVKWVKPLANNANFDTLIYTGPYTLNLKHRYNSQTTFTTIYSATQPSFHLLPTTGTITSAYTHSNINTVAEGSSYLVEFVAGTVTFGNSQRATSVFLSVSPNDRRMDLSWQSTTPWTNYKYTIYKRKQAQSTFSIIATTTLTSFTDNVDVKNDSTYCYKILAEGQYSDVSLPRPLLNFSQEVCATAIDLTPPCTPTITPTVDCDKGFLRIDWTDVRTQCPGSDDVYKYLLYYKETKDADYTLIDSLPFNTTAYVNDNDGFISGCYKVAAVDRRLNVSPASTEFCVDNCPIFELPNIVTVNGDGVNDFYKAVRVRQIKEINLQIWDRWGGLVYETKDPYFKWDCISRLSNQRVSQGAFFYVCEVFEPRLDGIKKRLLKGYLHVVE